MSLEVDIRGKDRYEGMEEFSLQMPVLRNYTYELFASNIVKNEDLISPRHEFVKLFVNGEYFGIRHVEEGFGRELVEASYAKLDILAQKAITGTPDDVLAFRQHMALTSELTKILKGVQTETARALNQFKIKHHQVIFFLILLWTFQ